MNSPPNEREAAVLAQLEAERERRIDEKVARGEVVRGPVVVVGFGHPAAIERERNRITAELRAAGEQREIVWGGQRDPEGTEAVSVIVTGVLRPGRDEEYILPPAREYAEAGAEEIRRREKEAAERIESFHEGSRSHEPEPPPAPLPKAVDVTPPGDLELYGINVQIVAPTPGDLGMVKEGKYGERDRVVYVMDDQGSHVATRLLHEGEGDVKTRTMPLQVHFGAHHFAITF
jgi:hypothetical protein